MDKYRCNQWMDCNSKLCYHWNYHYPEDDCDLMDYFCGQIDKSVLCVKEVNILSDNLFHID